MEARNSMQRYILFFMLCFACGRPTEFSHNKTIISNQAGDIGILGMGYNVDTGRFTGNRCFAGGEFIDIPGREATLNIERNLSYQELSKALSGSISLKVNVYPGIKATGQAHFASENASSKFNETFTLIFKAQSSRHRLYVQDPMSDDIKGTPVLQRLFQARDDYQWNQEEFEKQLKTVCGDEYVAYMEKGISLIATLKFEFTNEYDKKAFGGSLGVEVLEGIASGNIDVGLENSKANSKVNISLSIFQKGGNAQRLLEIFQSQSEEHDIDPVLQCTMENRNQCITVFRNLLNHAKQIKGDVLQSSTDFPNGEISTYETQPYPAVGIFTAIKGQVDPEERLKLAENLSLLRLRLLKWGGQSEADKYRANILQHKMALDFSNRPELLAKIKQVETKADYLQELVNKGMLACSPSQQIALDTCQEMVNLAEKQAGYDRSVLNFLPDQFYSWCVLAHSQDHLNRNNGLTVEGILTTIGLDFDDKLTLENDADVINDFCTQANQRAMALEELDLSFEHIHIPISSFLPITSLTQLKHIRINDQNLASIPQLKNFRSLESLSLNRNRITSFDDFVCLSLYGEKALSLAANYFTELLMPEGSCGTGSSWSTIDLSWNEIETINEIKQIDLTFINLEGNFLSDTTDYSSFNSGSYQINLKDNFIDGCPLDQEDRCTRSQAP